MSRCKTQGWTKDTSAPIFHGDDRNEQPGRRDSQGRDERKKFRFLPKLGIPPYVSTCPFYYGDSR